MTYAQGKDMAQAQDQIRILGERLDDLEDRVFEAERLTQSMQKELNKDTAQASEVVQ